MSSAPIVEVREEGPPPRWLEAVDATVGGVFHMPGRATHRWLGARAGERINGNLMVEPRRTAGIQRLRGLPRR